MKIKSVALFLVLIVSMVFAQNIKVEKGWQLKGTESSYGDMSSFNKDCIEMVWKYNNHEEKWEAFSANQAIKDQISNSLLISELTAIEPNDGFWIKASEDCDINKTDLKLVFQDNFENFSNSDDANWVSFGYPLPIKISNIEGSTNNAVWNSNGDDSYTSGSYLKTMPLQWNEEFLVEFRLKQPLANVEKWLHTILAITHEDDKDWTSTETGEAWIIISGGTSVNYTSEDYLIRADANGSMPPRQEANLNDGEWHIYKIYHKIEDDGKRLISISIDDVEFIKETYSDYIKDTLYITVRGRSYGGYNYLDYVKVYK